MITKIGAGRPKKSAKLKQLQGTFRAGREVQAVNNAPSITPTCPSSMTDAQKVIWHETVRLLTPLGLLHPEHEAILTLYCTARTTYNALSAVIAIEGVAVGGSRTSCCLPMTRQAKVSGYMPRTWGSRR